ncbi:MAG: non-canonical purine NTP diphosphatase [Rikenellaceae bacterium]
MKIVFASNNAHKVAEIQQILGDDFEVVTLRECGITEDIPETAETLEGNACLKAQYIYERLGVNCFADDTGLEVDALGGTPGVRSARYATDEGHDSVANNALLLKNMSGVEGRSAQFRTVIALILDGREHLFEGIVRGEICRDYAGGEGFGYDPLFVPDGHSRTFAQMSMAEKSAISHRGRAVAKLVAFLRG